MAHRVPFLARTAAGICLAALALAACGTGSANEPGPTRHTSGGVAGLGPRGLVGYEWLVVSITHDGIVTRIPARRSVDLQFSRHRQRWFLASDGVNSIFGTYRLTRRGFTIRSRGESMVAYLGHDPAVLVSEAAMSSLGPQAIVRLTGRVLVVRIGGYKLTCRRHGHPRYI